MQHIVIAVLGIVLAVPGTPAALAATEQLRFNVDAPPSGQSEPGPWTTGCFADIAAPADNGCITVAAPGSVARTQRPSGASTSPAIKFPAPGGGRAVLQIPHAAHLNPGSGDFTLSVLVKLTAAEVSPGANLVQKGAFASPGGQWKLQIDNGIPSCRIAGSRNGASVSVLLSWGSSIVGLGWTFVQCKRRGSVLSVLAGTGTPVSSPSDASMTIANNSTAFVGANGTGASNDQFHGAIDNVVFSTG